jgi:hypothetical protein
MEMTDFVEGIAHNMCTFNNVQRRKKRERAEATHNANAETQRLETDQTLSLPLTSSRNTFDQTAPPMLQGGIKKPNGILKLLFPTPLSDLGCSTHHLKF